jgi:hypothetical protein
MSLLDFLGFGSRRRTALRVFDAALVAGKVNPAYVDDGMRYVVYKWASEEESAFGLDPGHVDRRMTEAARLLSFVVLGPVETEREFGPDARQRGEAGLARALAEDGDDTFEARMIKLALARGIAAAEIVAQLELAEN